MKKIVVLSDSHNNKAAIDKLIHIMDEADYVISLGDNLSDNDRLSKLYPDKLISVKGNCDYDYHLQDEIIKEIEGVLLLITHGHRYRVKSGLEDIILRAEEAGANAVLFGHTHSAKIIDKGGVKLINPGTLCRIYDMSYCYIVIDNAKIYANILPLTY